MTGRPWNIAVIGAGAAGIFAADALQRHALPTRVDVFEKQPVPFGLVRYGIAPDHPLTSTLSDPLTAVLDRRDIRLLAGVDIGSDIGIGSIRESYDAVVITTGASVDAPLPIDGVGLPGSFGASQFVAWYNSHPDSREHWDLGHRHVAVVGAGNVALDLTRMLLSSIADLEQTDISERVRIGIGASRVTDVHLFARRGPAEAAFSAAELLELDRIPDAQIIVDPADMIFDRSSDNLMAASKQRRTISETLREWSLRGAAPSDAAKRIHLHFMEAPAHLTGDTHVDGITVERTRHRVNGTVEGTGYFRHYPVGQVYRAIGFASEPLPGVPFDASTRRIPNVLGRVTDGSGAPLPALYVAGWVKRGPVGLIGLTKADALQTVTAVVADLESRTPRGPDRDPLTLLTTRGDLQPVDWDGWLRVDRRERADGALRNRPRVRLAGRDVLLAVARGEREPDATPSTVATEECPPLLEETSPRQTARRRT